MQAGVPLQNNFASSGFVYSLTGGISTGTITFSGKTSSSITFFCFLPLFAGAFFFG
jgi:hypothetical protein